LIFVLVSIPIGCDRDVLDDLEKRVREDDTRRTHAATYLAIGVTQRAHRVADEIQRSQDPRCARLLPSVNRFELRIERKRGETNDAVYQEERVFSRDAGGRIRLTQKGRFQTPWDEESTFQNAIFVDHDKILIRDDQAEIWYRNDDLAETTVQDNARGMMQVLLDAVAGWQRQSARWIPGEERLRCEPVSGSGDSAWLARFEGRGKIVEASFVHETATNRRKFDATWKLDKGYELVVSARENWSFEPIADMVGPAPDSVMVVERDRSLFEAHQVVRELVDDAVLTQNEADREK